MFSVVRNCQAVFQVAMPFVFPPVMKSSCKFTSPPAFEVVSVSVCFLIVGFKHFFHILGTNILSDSVFQIFSPSLWLINSFLKKQFTFDFHFCLSPNFCRLKPPQTSLKRKLFHDVGMGKCLSSDFRLSERNPCHNPDSVKFPQKMQMLAT